MKNNTQNKQIKNPYRSLSFTLVILGLFFLPFNSYIGISFLGEFAQESCFIFFVLAFLIECIRAFYKQMVRIPWKHPIFIVLALILLWFFASYILNFIDIQNYYFKKTSGNNRFIRQYGAIIISALILYITYYNIFSRFSVDILFKHIRKIFLISFIVVSIYTLIEICIVHFNMVFLEPVIYLFDYFPFQETWLDYRNKRISSVSYAPPVFGMYLMTIAGWMFSYIITHKGVTKYVPTIFIMVFAVLSDSRSGLVIVALQLLVFLLYFIKKRKYHKNIIKIGFIVILFSTPLILLKGHVFTEAIADKITSFDLEKSKHSISNKSRLGMIYTSGLVFLENPIKGVGFGQQAYVARYLYPRWATSENWEFDQKYLNEKSTTFPPGFNIYSRLLAETGIIGFLLFVYFIFLLNYVCYKKIGSNGPRSVYFLVLLVSFIGYSLNWLQVDTFRVFGFWICLALATVLTKNQLSFGKPKE